MHKFLQLTLGIGVACGVVGNVAAASQPPLLDIGLGVTFDGGGSNVGNEELRRLQGGGHDPSRNGFTLPNVEMEYASAIDPYWRARGNIVYFIDAQGASHMEVEETYATSEALPGGLQLKIGQYFTEFGRLNSQHPEQWAFIDQPIILTRLFGADGLRSQGIRMAWLMPTDWYSEIYTSVQNASGDTLSSFIGPVPRDARLASVGRRVRSAQEGLYTFRWLNSVDVRETTMNFGVSAAEGPNDAGLATHTRVYGADFYAKWRALANDMGYPFVAVHAEALSRQYETDTLGTLYDRGAFVQALWGYARGWVLGARMEGAQGDNALSSDPLRDMRSRYALNLTYAPTEFSRLRVQYNVDRAEHLASGTAQGVWLQLQYTVGRHAPHSF